MAEGRDNRLIATMGLMARESDNEALIALRTATRMLAERGLRWEDVARLAVSRVQTQPAPHDDVREAPRNKAEPADRRARARAAYERAERHSAKPRRTVKGIDIPEYVTGRLIILEDEKRNRQGDEYTVVSIEGDDVVWGPMMVFDEHIRTQLHYLGDDPVGIEVEQPSNSLYNPIVTMLNTI